MNPTNSTTRFRFIVAAILLAAAGIFVHVAQSKGALQLIKKSLPIRKPLSDFDRSALSPLELVNNVKLAPDTVGELGTEEYINWALATPKELHRGRRLSCSLSVTYYTGVVDQVPHVPEECFFQGAFTQASDDVMDLNLPNLGQTVQVRRLSFFPPRDMTSRTFVYYTICVNGDFYGRRDAVRWRMADFKDSHLYYSKVEIALKEQPDSRIEDLDEDARFVLDKTLTELIRSHWPLRGWERGGPPSGEGSKSADQGQTAAKGV